MEPREPWTPAVAARVWRADMPVLPSLYWTGGGWPPDVWGLAGWYGSVVLGESALNVGAGQQHEDVCLDGLDEELEEDHGHRHHEGDAGAHDQPAVQEVPGGHGEHDQHQVTGEHVGEESHRVRERADQQVREELDDHHERQHRAERLVVAGDVLEEADEAVLL